MFNNLIQLAKKEEIPNIDISNCVMLEIQNRKSKVNSKVWKPMGLVAMISSIAASIIIFFTINTYKDMHDPYFVFFAPYSISMEIPVDLQYNQ